MNAHILTIGDEILIGQTLNTNAAYIGSKLIELNINVCKTSVVGDNEKVILNEFKACFDKNDLVVVTGGLGPTHDDITRSCVVKFFNTELVMNDDVLKDVNQIFSKRGRIVTKVNEEQALVPKIANVIRNSLGTAPGIWIEKDQKIFVVMPGVPFEMKEMMDSYILPKLNEKIGVPEFVTGRINLQTTGIPESYLYERLGDINELLNGAQMAFLPSQYGVKLRVTATDKSSDLVNNKLSEIEQKIRNKVGRFVFAKGEETLEEVVGRLLKERELTLAVAESCTGGNIANLLTNISGSSDYFERGVVSYSNASKVEMLQVNEDTIMEHGAVSRSVAEQMAKGIKSISGTDLGLSVTGILGPTGATPGKPIGVVYIAICDNITSIVKKFLFGEDRILNKQRATQAALDMLRKHILGIQQDE
ncbi:MAG: competence/damage-inducible protein A [Ignavibacteriaceae bacterium]|nr:competence/damage-inducible protein A [Ignavibacteriaceae bacterium]